MQDDVRDQEEHDADADMPASGSPEPGSALGRIGSVIGGAFRLANRGREAVADIARSSAHKAEARALSTLKRKLDSVGEESQADSGFSYTSMPASHPEGASASASQPSRLLAQMLEVAMEQSQEEARQALYLSLLRQLVPDEVRLLSAMADGSAYAMCHLGAGPRVGPPTHRILENLSVIGRAAGVRLLDATPHYVKHLRDLGLVDSGPENPALNTKYEMLETDSSLRSSVEHIEKVMKLKPRFFRRTIHMSDFGKQLWAACHNADL